MIILQKEDEAYIRIDTNDQSVLKEMVERFSFLSPGYHMDWRFKNHTWNGRKCVFNSYKRRFPIGLLPKLTTWLDESGYEYKVVGNFNAQEFSEYEAKQFIRTLNLPFEVRDYQLRYFIKAVRNRRAVLLSPTSSGKSLLIYLMFRYFNTKTLLIVPTVGLVTQMFKDFKSYGYELPEDSIHMIYAGKEKPTQKQMTISTWQSIVNQDAKFFEDFGLVIGDEAHGFQANSLMSIMTKLKNTSIRIGLTGTLSGNDYDDHIVEGLFGPVTRYITTRDMIDQGYASNILIKCIVLDHVNCKYKDLYLDTSVDYREEIEYLILNEKRNRYIRNLALSLKGNTFVMFKFIAHGKEIYEQIKKKADCPVYYVDGQTSAEERESIRLAVESCEKSITVASVVFATGINITSINNIIFMSPSKKRIKILQSIGRGLRLGKFKCHMELFDIADDLVTTHNNTTMKHFKERVKLYRDEQFDFKFYKVDLKNEQTQYNN